MKPEPPRLPRLALRLFIAADRREEVEGDLLELFDSRMRQSGDARARVRYWRDVASALWHARYSRTAALISTPTPARGFHTMLWDALSELRYAARTLVTRPGYALVATFTLALGIGSNAAIFTVLYAVLLRPLPYPDADRIVEVRHHAPGMNMPEVQSSPGLIAHYRQSARTLMNVAGYQIRQMNLAGDGMPERVRVVAAAPDLFNVLATRPAFGRPFEESDTHANASPVTILSHPLWQARFGGDFGIVGRMVTLDGRTSQVIGVMPRDFAFPDAATQLYVPLRIDAAAGFGPFGMRSIAQLAPGATVEAARVEIEQLQRRIPEWFPDITPQVLADFGWSSAVEPLHTRVVASVSTTLWILFGTVGLVLLVAGANVANLFLVRAESRQHEVAVRSALGASRGRIAVTFLAESLVLASIGGVAGLLLADAGTRLLVAYGPPRLPRLHEVRTDATVAAFTAALSVVSALVLGALPTLATARRSVTLLLREGGRGSTAGRARHRVRQVLIVTQVAMATMLLVGSGLMFRSVARLSGVDPGFRADGLVTAGISLGPRADRASAVALYHRMLEEMAALPGVTRVGAASTLPVGATGMTGANFEVQSRPAAAAVPLFTMYSAVTAGYFETLGVPLLEGRAPERADADQRRPVAWVNKTFVRQFLNKQATGERIKIADVWLEIVGVVGDLRTSGLAEDARPMVYVPLSNAAVPLDVVHAVVRSDGDPASLAHSLRAAVDRVNPSVPLTSARTMEDVVAASVAQATFTMTLLAIAAGIALVLGVVGLYGVISYIVTQRAGEISVRLALGAKPGAVCVMVLRQGVAVAVTGVIAGLAVAWASMQLMASMLFEVSSRDPVTYAMVALILTVVSAVATYVPARRAAGMDPVEALREQR